MPSDSGVHAVNAGAEAGRACGADAIVSVGGGTVIDTAKGIAILLTEGGSLMDYQGFQVLSRRQTPHVAVPTTAGTGSEITYVAVIKDHDNHHKLLFADHHIIPDVAILDPALTVGLPPRLTAATGLDAFSHGLEALTSAQRQPVADALGLHAIRLVHRFLPRAVRAGTDIVARGQMLAAATLGGAAFSNAQVGMVHAIAHVLGGRHGVHHGVANAVLLPHVMRHNNPAVADRHRAVAEAMGLDVRALPTRPPVSPRPTLSPRSPGASACPGRSPSWACPRAISPRAPKPRCPTAPSSTTRSPSPIPPTCSGSCARRGGAGRERRAGRARRRGPGVPIHLAPGAHEVGLTTMLADLIRQSVEQKPKKRLDFDRLRTVVEIHVRDAEVTVSLEFEGGCLTVHGGMYATPKIRISADAEAVLALCMIKLVGGVPHPLHHHNRRLIRMMATGEIRIEGIPRNPLALLRFARLVSVRE